MERIKPMIARFRLPLLRTTQSNKIVHKNVTSSQHVADYYVTSQEISVYGMWPHIITQLLSDTQQ